jgi:tetratricopeptide (TPR) repeat protein
VLQAQGDLPGARAKLERVLEIEVRLYSSHDHYSTAISEMNLGFLLLEQGDTTRAVELLSHAYQVFRSQLGPEHPHTQSLAHLFADSASATPDPVRMAITQARAAAQRGDLSAAIEAQERAVTHLRSTATDDRDTLVTLSVLLYNLAQYYTQAGRWHDAVAALAEVVALDEGTGHEDLASDRAALEQARRMAAATPEERSRLGAAADALSQIQDLADQARDAAIAALRGEFDRHTLLTWLGEAAERAASDELPDSPWAQLATYLQAVAALLRNEPTRTVPAAFAAHLDAIEAARHESA